MRFSLRSHGGDADREAREWFVRLLDDDVAQEDLEAWTRWSDASPANREAFERVSEAWDSAGAAAVERPSPRELAEDAYPPALPVAGWRKARRARLRVVWGGAAAALAVALLGSATGAFLMFRPPPVERLATRRGEHMQARLSDGSEIHLGGRTSVELAFGRSRRNVGLDTGEALFKVAHDRSRPFVVETPLAAITAVGTAFNVDVESQVVTLYVSEGVVSVDPAPQGRGPAAEGALLRVAAGQRVRMERAGARLVVMQTANPPPPSWLQGRLEYRNEPLRSVIEDVNRYASRRIVIGDPALGDLSFTGTVQLALADSWAYGLAGAFPVLVEANGPSELVLRKKPASPIPAPSPNAS